MATDKQSQLKKEITVEESFLRCVFRRLKLIKDKEL